jgi:predicted KAP-like P-loop ATPase
MIRERLEEQIPGGPIVTEVNPWLFSGTEQLVELFIRDLADQLASRTDQRAATVSQRLREYSAALDDLSWIPVAGRLPAGMRVLAWIFGRRNPKYEGSIDKRRTAIGKALKESGERLLVIVDDIDRLTDPEIRDVVRTVRLVGDFANVTYLLAFDRVRVEKALESNEPGSGRDYLEKIVQAVHPLPAIRYDDLSTILGKEVDAALQGLETGPFDLYDWQNIGSTASRPLFRSVRDVYRYTNVLPATVRAIGNEIALQDVLALEAVRVLEPDVWDALVVAAPALGYTRDVGLGGGPTEERLKALVDRVLEVAGEQEGSISELLHRVFPATDRFTRNTFHGPESLAAWRRGRRVAHPTVFAVYLERTLAPDTVPAAVMERIFTSLEDEAELADVMSELSPSQLEESLARLEAWEHEFPPPEAGCIGVIYRESERLRQGRRGLFDFGADLAVSRVVLRMFRRSDDPADRLAVVEEVLVRDLSLSAAIDLLLLVGHEENAGHELIPKEDADRLNEGLALRIAGSDPADLAKERELPRLISWVVRKGDEASRKRVDELLVDDALLAALLRQSLSEGYSQAMDEVAQRAVATLPWDWLQGLLPKGDLDRRVMGLRDRLDRSTIDQRMADALDLADRYAGGWRPDRRD